MARLNINEMKDMAPEMAEKLTAAGIKHTDALLERARTPGDRRALAKELGCTPSELLEFVNRAELAQLKGVGRQFSDLLEDAGVDSIKELARRRPENLHAKMLEAAEASGVKRPPRLADVEAWIEQAKAMGTTVQEG